jgi:UDP-N-acetylglucosamine 2-epimerase (non-hydrolysing)
VAVGNAVLVGTSTSRIIEVARRLLDDRAALASMSRPSFPYGDGKAALRIAAIIQQWLNNRGKLQGFASAPPMRGR